MCPPDYFQIDYEINPWMHRSVKSLSRVAHDQWWDLHQTLTEGLGCIVDLIRPQQGLPDLVFTANAGLCYRDVFIPARFRHEERRGEEAHFLRFFRSRKCRIIEIPGEVPFEGAGDALFSADDLFAAYHFRSDIEAHAAIAEFLGVRALSLMLADPRFYHLDTCFCPLWNGEVIYFPGAFDAYAREVIEDRFPAKQRYAVSEEEALRFACNAVALPEDVVVPSGCPKVLRRLKRWGYRPHEVKLTEFMKSGGSAKCLTLLTEPSPPGVGG
ncbi:MAG: amidinotransferase [Planctomycetes bacterium]|nr:amidinotransferase [Planctomycetota bacterium]